MAALLTTVLVVGLTIYAFVTEIDYTKFLIYLFIVGLVLLTASLMAMFIRVPILHTIIAALTVILFGIYLIVDTQLILGKHSTALEMDDYIMAAMLLYIDIITIFLEILKVMGSKN